MRQLNLVLALATAGVLAACGGGGDDAAAPAPAPAPPPAPVTLTLTGVVAKGAALVGATVDAKCASGTVATPAVTTSTGSYSLTVNNATLPCVIEATGTGADASLVLHSVATGASGATTATSNVTPVTELLVAQLTGANPAELMSASAASLSSIVTDANLVAAKEGVIEVLQNAGIDTAALGSADMLTGTLEAGSMTNYDGVLEALGDALAVGGTTLTELTTTVAAASAAAAPTGEPATASSPTAQLPASLQLLPKAANCDFLRSTQYRLIKFAASAGEDDTPNTANELFTVDATAETFTFGPNDTFALTPTNTKCRYTMPDASGDVVISPAGVMVIRAVVGTDDDTVGMSDRGQARLMMALPVQDLSLAEVAGPYTAFAADRGDRDVEAGYFTIGADGVVDNFRCWGDDVSLAEAACLQTTTTLTERFTRVGVGQFNFSANPADPEPFTDRTYAFKSGAGEVLIVGTTSSGEPFMAVKKRVLALPAVGRVTTDWSIGMDVGYVAAPGYFTQGENTVTALDTSAGSYTRSSVPITLDGVRETANTTTQTVYLNSGRAGYVSRPAIPAANVRAFNGMSMPGLGLTALYLPNTLTNGSDNSRIVLSVRQPAQ